MKSQKSVTVLNVYKFNHIARICFEVLASNETDKYNTCFNGDADHGACGCDGFAKYHRCCYHIVQLRPRAQAYFDSRKPVAAPVQPVQPSADEQAYAEAYRLAHAWETAYDPTLEPETYLEKLHRLEREQAARIRGDWKESSQFGAQDRKMERAPSGRLVPMR